MTMDIYGHLFPRADDAAELAADVRSTSESGGKAGVVELRIRANCGTDD
jgi:hypothetical protein